MFAYRARPCTVQLAWDEGGQVAVVDTLATSIAPLGELLGPDGPVKIVHDVAFDARLLAESGIALANVHDTAVAARMLSRLATGLATLLDVELGVHIGKAMQQHDWRLRPLDDRMLEYLAADVVHLEALEQQALDRGRRARDRGRRARGDALSHRLGDRGDPAAGGRAALRAREGRRPPRGARARRAPGGRRAARARGRTARRPAAQDRLGRRADRDRASAARRPRRSSPASAGCAVGTPAGRVLRDRPAASARDRGRSHPRGRAALLRAGPRCRRRRRGCGARERRASSPGGARRRSAGASTSRSSCRATA